MTDPRPDYVLRLTGEQIGSIDPPPDGDWFVDFDEYEDFVPRRMLDAATDEVERLDYSLRLLRYLWQEADVPSPYYTLDTVGTPGKVREWFAVDDPLSVDIEAALGEEAER